MLGGVLLLVGIILLGVGTQAGRERKIEIAEGLPAGKGLSAVPFYVLGAIAFLVGIALLTNVFRLT